MYSTVVQYPSHRLNLGMLRISQKSLILLLCSQVLCSQKISLLHLNRSSGSIGAPHPQDVYRSCENMSKLRPAKCCFSAAPLPPLPPKPIGERLGQLLRGISSREIEKLLSRHCLISSLPTGSLFSLSARHPLSFSVCVS